MFVRPAVLAVVVATAGVVHPVHARDRDRESVREQLQKQLTPTAELIVKVMQSEKLKKISFGNFTSPQGPESAYATGMREELVTAVAREASDKKYPIEVTQAEGELQVLASMRYAQTIKDGTGKELPAAIQVRFTLDKASGEIDVPAAIKQEIAKANQPGLIIGDANIAAEATGSNVVFKPGASAEKNLDDLNKQKNAGATFQVVDDRLVRAAVGSPYGIEILVVDVAKLPATVKDWEAIKAAKITTTSDGKFPFVALAPGHAYAIKVTNNTKFDAAVEISIDGLDVFHFVDKSLRQPDGRSRYSCYVVPRADQGGYGVVPGWHKDNSESYAFVVRELGKANDKKEREKGVPSSVKAKKDAPGVITVRIAGAWNKEEDDKVGADIRGGRNGGKNETDTGAPVKTGFVEVQKEIGKFNTVISIHYSH